jgi:serine/threonine protein kinase
MTSLVGVRFGPYEVIEPIGAGGMGEVYRARDHRLRRDVALKVLPEHARLDPARRSRLQREARTLASLNHPNIATILGVESAQGVEAIVLELVDGITLADRIARGSVPIGQALPVARQIIDALLRRTVQTDSSSGACAANSRYRRSTDFAWTNG